MHTLTFDKYQALGNDFIVLDGRDRALDLTPAQIARLADRRRGPGCDQVLIARPDKQAQLEMQVFNQDGSAAEQCGNGLRCVARYAFDHEWITGDCATIRVGRHISRVTRKGETYSAEMGRPEWRDERISFNRQALSLPANMVSDIGSGYIAGVQALGALDFPNPHLVLQVPSVEDAPVAELGAWWQESADFPNRVNVGFMQVIDRATIRLRVYERGVGETTGCGSGAAAAVAAGQKAGLLDDSVKVELPGGSLQVSACESGYLQQGPAEYVFSGQIPLPLSTRQAA